MKVLVSSCLMGINCKYNGKNNKNQSVIHFLKEKDVICICPELLTGMGSPRPCVELVNGVAMDENGNNVDREFRSAVALALSQIQNEEIDFAILQSRSPTCGVNQIYDGSFTGKLIPGMGLFAKALKEKGYRVIDAEEL
ncbi:DUF523 domain-containing protein [Petralouisia muris]|uniref:DUF523 domain-containing protein n=1 Tax=Petralouisia muris TaxID=3032872 RepID=A0AC61S227_9FIRM|nr:DUF523 domain-containing protein [Petralouisia muris]TGY98397.1 DUF523 domain-containing protein [Petralouisia muris]